MVYFGIVLCAAGIEELIGHGVGMIFMGAGIAGWAYFDKHMDKGKSL